MGRQPESTATMNTHTTIFLPAGTEVCKHFDSKGRGGVSAAGSGGPGSNGLDNGLLAIFEPGLVDAMLDARKQPFERFLPMAAREALPILEVPPQSLRLLNVLFQCIVLKSWRNVVLVVQLL